MWCNLNQFYFSFIFAFKKVAFRIHLPHESEKAHLCIWMSMCRLNVSFFLFRHHYIFVVKQMKDKTCVDCKNLLCTWKLLPLSDGVCVWESTEVFLSPHSKRRTSRKQDSKVNSRELVCYVCLWVDAGLFLYPEFASLNLLGNGKKVYKQNNKMKTVFL